MPVKGPLVITEGEEYEKTWLWLILKLFHFFGFRLLNDSGQESYVSRIYVGLVLAMTLLSYGTGSYMMSYILLKNDGSLDFENACFYAVMGFFFSACLLNYVVAVAKTKDISVLMRSLASAIDGIPDQDQKESVIKQFKKNFHLWCIPYIVCGTSLSLITVGYNYNIINHYNLTEVSIYLSTISMVTNVIWFFSVGSFYFFMNALILAFCKLLNAIIDVYLKPKVELMFEVRDIWAHSKRCDVVQKEEIVRNMFFHQKMSALVEKTNSVFAHFLLLTLALEIIFCIVIVKLITIKNGAFSFAAYVSIPHIILLVLKAFACANVNDKLKSSKLLKQLPNPNDFSNEQVSYLLYMEEQNISKAELTYGNIFPVTKTFIFTIAGTALTYALVLQGIDQSS